MRTALDLWPFVVLGALGWWHCAGMCGGFAIALARRAPRGRVLAHQLLHGSGKALTYGVVAAALAAGAGEGSALGLELRTTLRWLAAGALIVAGVESLGWRLGSGRLVTFVQPVLEALRRLVRTLDGAPGAFGLGVVNGLLPCGLSLGAVLLAAEHAPPVAFAAALVFGLSTTPALLAVGALPRFFGVGALRRLRPALGVVTIAFGLALLWRGAAMPGVHGSSEACCSTLSEVESP